MGKDLKGRELGKGVVQRKDKRYYARYTDFRGKRVEGYFDKVTDAKRFVAEGKLNYDVSDVSDRKRSFTVDEWYNFWMITFKSGKSPNTQRNYRDRYKSDIKPVIGDMPIEDVRVMHCQKVINNMVDKYAQGTIYQTYICMGGMLKSAVQNGIISKHPMDGLVMPRGRRKKDIHFLTIEEQEKFVEAASKTHNSAQFRLLLNTGLRTGELIGLSWDDIDFEARTISVNRTLEYRYSTRIWRAGPPKTMSSYRTIPMTKEAYEILLEVWEKKPFRKESELLKQELEYIDLRNNTTKKIKLSNLVFINYRTGEPTKNSSYDTNLYKICERAGIKPFCMHALRHTFATRCIERGVKPKALQKILGHSNLATTMDTYVHMTDDSLAEAMDIFENGQ